MGIAGAPTSGAAALPGSLPYHCRLPVVFVLPVTLTEECRAPQLSAKDVGAHGGWLRFIRVYMPPLRR
jgi:hypothetical protein